MASYHVGSKAGRAGAHAVPQRKPAMNKVKNIATPKMTVLDLMLPVPKFSLSRERGSRIDSSSRTMDMRLKISMYKIATRWIQRATVLSVTSRV